MTCCCLLLPAANLIECHVGEFYQKELAGPLGRTRGCLFAKKLSPLNAFACQASRLTYTQVPQQPHHHGGKKGDDSSDQEEERTDAPKLA